MVMKRITTELTNLQKSPPEGVSIKYDENNLAKIKIYIDGPKNTPYEGGKFEI